MTTSADNMANAFAAEANVVPGVNVTGVEAPTATTTTADAPGKKFYTDEDLARVRSQEKDKLYPQIETLKDEISALRKDRDEDAARKATEAQAEADRVKATEMSELDSKAYADVKLSELQEQLELERTERERAFALLEREKTYADLQAYRQQILEVERDNIIPQLVDFIQGNSREELVESVERLKERSASILESAQTAMQGARQAMRGASVTSPPAGPLETNTEQRTLTPQEIAEMPMDDYAKIRGRLLSESARGKSRGLFG
ncbi:hypothetical protein UFOVP965_144 [uncultured Caudovirales phage]|uniref:Scaffolding protein n=1 Tax=uncultured Caudovirales phage TaxID=2100421 RepID=A0A6J5QW40_9CAUD|nr:hypothetical protein UFOVP965_144 [uncultured Caudovirales phage]CAB4179933.1 hypothetical protein UFOVP1035_140 [uncultured Caudovirales phage]CAB4188790.1 hypothetical protein UFOVP1181_99 [uncultured Caudovirales phage]